MDDANEADGDADDGPGEQLNASNKTLLTKVA